MSEPLVDAVLFDYGGVLTSRVGESIAAWHAADGIDPQSFSVALKQWLSRTVPWVTPIHRLETGALPHTTLDAPGPPWPPWSPILSLNLQLNLQGVST